MLVKNKTKVTAEPGKQELFITREFDAPRELVFRAFTEPELFVRWIGPSKYTTRLETFEAVSGGKYRYFSVDDDGTEYGFSGTFHELSLDRLIQTFEFEGMPERGHVALDCMTLEQLPGGRTRLTGQSVYRSVADRDGMLQSGMESGMSESFERLDQILENLL